MSSKRTVLWLFRWVIKTRGANCGLHPLIHTCLGFVLAQNVGVSQRFSGFGNSLPQTGHALSSGSTIVVSLHLEHLPAWTFTCLISSGSRLVNRFSKFLFAYFSVWDFLRSKGINFVSVDSNWKISASNRPPSSTDKAPYANLPFTVPVLAIVRRPEQASSPSKYPAMVTFSASILPKALPSLKISKVREIMLPVKDPMIITFPGIFSSPLRLDVSEMIVISSDLIRIFSNFRMVYYFSDSSSPQLMPWSWRHSSIPRLAWIQQ